MADATSAPELSPEERQFLSINVQPNSLLDATGEKLTSGTVGISTVPPELVRDMLPAGVLQHTFDITVQAPGISNFSTPAPMSFPNVFDAAPGTQLDFLSFDHTTGRLVIEGTATVSPDGQFASTDPGTGITHPGWHGLTPPGILMLSKGSPPPCPSGSHEPGPGDTTTVLPPEGVLLFGEDDMFSIPAFQVPPNAQPAPSHNCPQSENQVARLEVDINIEGPLKDFAEQAGSLKLKNQVASVTPGQKKDFAVKLKPYDDIDNLPDFAKLEADHLFGSKIEVSQKSYRSDGSTHTEEKTYYLYRWLDVIAGQTFGGDDDTASFHHTLADGTGGFVRSKEVELHLPESFSTEFVGSNSEFQYPGSFKGKTTAQWSFDPVSEGFKEDTVTIEADNSAVEVGKITASGRATAPTTINLNLERFEQEFTNLLTNSWEDPQTGGIFYTSATNPNHEVVFFNAFLEQFGAFMGGRTFNPQDLRNAVEEEAASIGAAVRSHFLGPINTQTAVGYEFVDSGQADITVEWSDFIESIGPQGNIVLALGVADSLDRWDAFLSSVLPKDISEAAKNFALAEGLNREVMGTAKVELALHAQEYLQLGLTYGEMVAGTVSHEIAHTFGINESYYLDAQGKPKNVTAGIMSGDVLLDREFKDENAKLLQAALGFHESPNQQNQGAPLGKALDWYRQSFNYPWSDTALTPRPGPGSPTIEVSAGDESFILNSTIDFGTIAADGTGGAFKDLELAISSAGRQPLIVDSSAITDGSQGFSIVGPTVADTSLDLGESETVILRFDPETVGSLEDAFVIISNAAGRETFTLRLEGEAIPHAPTARVTGIDNNLGGVPAAEGGTEKDRIATISNEGAEALVISGIELAEGIGRFDLLGLPADLAANPIVLNTGEDFSFGVRFDPDYVGLDRALIDIATNDPDQPTVRLSAVGTGLDEVVYPKWGNDFIAVHTPRLPGAEILRTVSDDGGNFEFFIAPEEYYEFLAFDPDTGLIGEDTGYTPVSGRELDPASSTFMLASREPDSDFDGLPDDIETAIGTSITNPDTDGDGIDDFSAIQQKIDPLGESVLPIGVVSAIRPFGNGFVSDVVASGNTAYIASGSSGVQAVNLERITKPIVTASIPTSDLGGNAEAVAFTSIPGESPDSFVNLVAAAVGSGGLAIIDVTDPGGAEVVRQVSLDGSAQKVEIVDTFAYVGKSDGQIDVVDLKTGTLVSSFAAAGSGTISEVRASGGILYTLRVGTLAAYDIAADFAAPPLLSSLGVSRAQGLFVGSDRAYLTGFDELTPVDITKPTNLQVTSGSSPTRLNYRAVASNGSGRLLVGTATTTVGNFDTKLSLFNVEDPDEIGSFLTEFDTPGKVQDIWIQNGLALVADGSGGLAVFNYMQPDPGETPPTLTVSTTSADGSTVVEGQRLRVDVNTLDDVQTSQVRLVANGVDLQADGSFPFSFFVEVPPLSSGVNTLALEVIATDTGGNESTEQVEFSIVEDTTGPQLRQVLPVYRETPSQAIDSFQAIFNEPLAADSIKGNSVRIVKIENGSQVEQTIGSLSFEPELNLLTVRPAEPLGAGNYELQLDRELLTDRAGNAWGTGLFKSPATVEVAYKTGALPEEIEVGDFNNDDRLDLVVANRDSDSISILLGNGDGTLQAAAELPAGFDPTSIALADLDSDGDEDLLVALAGYSYNSDRVTEFFGDGTGNFVPGDSYPVGNEPDRIALGDVDSDGKEDLVTTYAFDGTVSVLSGNSDGSFGTSTDIDLDLDELTSVSLADLDADSDEEVIVSGYGYGGDQIAVLGLDGAALSDLPDTYDLGAIAEELALGDLDGDGDLDLVSANGYSNNSSVLLNNGDGSFAPKTDYPTGSNPVSVALGDLDGDGILDVATANASGSISVLVGTGNGALNAPEDLPVGEELSDIALGDFDGDGKLDVAVSDVEEDRLYIVGNWFTPGA